MTLHVIRYCTGATCAAVAVGLLSACSLRSSISSPSSALPVVTEGQSHLSNGRFVPEWSAFATVVPPEQRPLGGTIPFEYVPEAQTQTTGGIYASEVYGTDIWGFRANNSRNSKAICAVKNVSGPNGIAVDGKSNLVDPDGGTRTVIVFKGPKMCGSEIGSVSDPYGQPSDAASTSAATGTIVVANIFDNNKKAGSVVRCSLSGGCKAHLKNPNMYEVAAVALAKNGDCWASATNKSGKATLTYFKGCTGTGKRASGYLNAYYGGLDIDVHGNLVSLSYYDKNLYVYKGCNPACTLVGGPFAMRGEATFGHLNSNSTKLVTGDYQYGEIDVYNYSPTALKFAYRFNKGFSPSELVEGAAYDPRSAE
jgi:hypothetical protein